MTLLITTAGERFLLSSSDVRISYLKGKSYHPVDESFNKHFVFLTNDLKAANLTYTGVAQWTERGQKVRMHDLISDSLVAGIEQGLVFMPLMKKLCEDMTERLKRPGVFPAGENPFLEMHVVALHTQVPGAFIAVISTGRQAAPWHTESELQWHFRVGMFTIDFSLLREHEVIIGGRSDHVRPGERERILRAARAGAAPFDLAQMASGLIEAVSRRTTSVGPKSVSVVLPEMGMIDTDHFVRDSDQLIGFIPKMIFPNGVVFAPTELPVSLQLLTAARFHRAGVASTWRRPTPHPAPPTARGLSCYPAAEASGDRPRTPGRQPFGTRASACPSLPRG